MNQIVNYLKLLLPIEPCDADAANTPVLLLPVQQALQSALSYLGPAANIATERLLALCVINDNVAGLTFPIGAEQVPLLLVVVQRFVERPEVDPVPSQFKTNLLAAVSTACQQLQYHPYAAPPTYDGSPLLACTVDLAKSNLFPRALDDILWNLIDLLRSSDRQLTQAQIQKSVYDLSWAVRHYSLKVLPQDIVDLPLYPVGDEVVKRLWRKLNETKPTNQRTYRTYRRDIERLVQTPGAAALGGLRHGRHSQTEYDLWGEDQPIRSAFALAADEVQSEMDDGLAPFTETDVARERRASRSTVSPAKKTRPRQHHYRYEWPQTIQRNPSRHTPGVLKAAELAALFHRLADDTRWPSTERRDRAALVLMAGCFNGWTKQLLSAQVAKQAPPPSEHPGIVWLPDGWVSLRPQVPLGWPDLLQAGHVGTDPHERFIKIHFSNYERVSSVYQFALHPVIATVAQRLLRRASRQVFITQDDYTLALHDLTTQLQSEFPNAVALTGGRLMATFRGWAQSLALDGPDSFVVCGRPMQKHEMPLNYTLIPVVDACEHHWQFIDNWLAELAGECAASNWTTGELLQPSGGLPDHLSTRLTDQTGSCFVMQWDRLTRLFRFVAEQSSRTDLPTYETFNWQMRRLGFEAGLLLLMRPFEFEAMPLTPNHQFGGPSIAYLAKTKPGDEQTVVHKYMAPFLQERWHNLMAQCAADYAEGPVWCLRGSAGERLPFNLQNELNFTLGLLAVSDGPTRSYSLRHTGRTLHRKFGMRELFLNYKMNHDSLGCELFNPARPDSYREFRLEDDAVVERIVQALGIS